MLFLVILSTERESFVFIYFYVIIRDLFCFVVPREKRVKRSIYQLEPNNVFKEEL